MPPDDELPGCRDTVIATVLLLGLGLAFMIVGLTLSRRSGCGGACETLGLTLLYAGAPISAAFGIFFDGLVLAWPLDITLWVTAGFLIARWVARRDRGVLGPVVMLVVLALIYGLVLSQLVEIAV
ncbi:MAG: hypothetical protein WD269_00310 [Acidimicrobiia bacterium]